jgi:hypothetical protein
MALVRQFPDGDGPLTYDSAVVGGGALSPRTADARASDATGASELSVPYLIVSALSPFGGIRTAARHTANGRFSAADTIS